MDAGIPPPADAVERAKTVGRFPPVLGVNFDPQASVSHHPVACLLTYYRPGLIGAKFMGLNRNKTVVTIVLSGALSGYYFTEAFTQTALKQLQVEWEKRQKEPSQGEEPPA
ncbi:hypothetical protein EDD85DRAFT_943577 [Armillaria nabsnona]|nr:hypothetical protein EDD85DRAFT_943577 [Armillaria nabsnona]